MMEKIVGFNKSLEEQIKILESILLENKKLVVFAPYGLNDLFSMTIRSVKKEFTK